MQMNVANGAINSAKCCLCTATENTETIRSSPRCLSPLPSPLPLLSEVGHFRIGQSGAYGYILLYFQT